MQYTFELYFSSREFAMEYLSLIFPPTKAWDFYFNNLPYASCISMQGKIDILSAILNSLGSRSSALRIKVSGTP